MAAEQPIWRNWTGDQVCAPALIERPGSEAELVEAAGRAAEVGRRVRVAGSGHSFTDIACTDGHLLRLDRMDRLLDVDRERRLVTVEPGITLRRLGPLLAEQGLAMENLGDIDAQELGGAIATATHGTGGRFTSISAQVAGLRLVTAGGEVVECSEETDPDLLAAARVSLGALGAISAVTLRCVPLFTLRRVDEPRPLDETLARLEELVDGHDHFELYVFPYSERALTRSTTRTEDPPQPPARWKAWVQDSLIENRAMGALSAAGRRFPSLIPAINRRIGDALTGGVRTDLSYRVFASRREVRFTEMEYAIPREAAAVAAERVLDLVRRRRLPVGFPIEVRFVAPDDAWLGTAHGRDTAYIAVHMFHGMEFETYFRGVEAIMDDYGGRPHWGKRHYQTAATLRPRYPRWDDFQSIRAKLDPTGLFSNSYTDRVLGRPGPL